MQEVQGAAQGRRRKEEIETGNETDHVAAEHYALRELGLVFFSPPEAARDL